MIAIEKDRNQFGKSFGIAADIVHDRRRIAL